MKGSNPKRWHCMLCHGSSVDMPACGLCRAPRPIEDRVEALELRLPRATADLAGNDSEDEVCAIRADAIGGWCKAIGVGLVSLDAILERVGREAVEGALARRRGGPDGA